MDQTDTVTNQSLPGGMAIKSTPDSRHPDHTPAPWTCKCETYWLPIRLQKPLPAGIYDSLEASHPATSTDSFTGGLGMIHIVRYSDTPVGSYDELAIVPGMFRAEGGKEKGKDRMRVTRIYVNQRETCWNGRNNWNIAKHMARFEFSSPPVTAGSSPPTSLQVSVFPPAEAGASNPDKPFFSATLQPWRYPTTFPLSTSWLPMSSTLVQPPIPAAKDDVLLCGQDTWKTLAMQASTKKARIVSVTVHDSEREDQENWWPVVKPYSLGAWLEDATIDIHEPEEFNV